MISKILQPTLVLLIIYSNGFASKLRLAMDIFFRTCTSLFEAVCLLNETFCDMFQFQGE